MYVLVAVTVQCNCKKCKPSWIVKIGNEVLMVTHYQLGKSDVYNESILNNVEYYVLLSCKEYVITLKI